MRVILKTGIMKELCDGQDFLSVHRMSFGRHHYDPFYHLAV